MVAISGEGQVGMVMGNIDDDKGPWKCMSLKEKRVRNEAEGSEGYIFREGGSCKPLIILYKL